MCTPCATGEIRSLISEDQIRSFNRRINDKIPLAISESQENLPGFQISGKSQTIEDFTVSRLSQILPTNAGMLKIVDIPDRLGWTGTNLENRERFYFPDASLISAMVGDHSRQMKTQICTDRDVGNGFRSLLVP